MFIKFNQILIDIIDLRILLGQTLHQNQKKLELESPIEDIYGYLTTVYLNITFNRFDGQGPRTYTLAMKPKPWSTAKGAWFVEYLLNNPNNMHIDNSSTKEINPL